MCVVHACVHGFVGVCGHMCGCAYELKRLMSRVVPHHSVSHLWMQDLSIKPTIAFMVNLDRQCALKSPASTPEGSITGLPPYPHSIYLGGCLSIQAPTLPPFSKHLTTEHSPKPI